MWNNQEIRVDNKPVFYKKLFEQDVIFINDLLFDTTNSFTIVSNKISKINYLNWAGLRHSVPKHLKNSNCLRSEISLIWTIDNKEFDILEKKSKDYYMLIKRIIAQCLPSYTISSIYSESPPYSHLGNTVTSLLRPRFLAAWQDGHTFSCKKKKTLLIRSPVNAAKFFWPIGDRIDGVPLYLPTSHPFHFYRPSPLSLARFRDTRISSIFVSSANK